jgi:hypothetical protein
MRKSNLLLIVLATAFLSLAGCAALGLDPAGLEQARETAERVESEYRAAASALIEAGVTVDAAKAAYDAAKASGNATTLEAAAAALAVAISDYEKAKNLLDTGKAAVEASIRELENAKQKNNYLPTILGMLGTGFLAFFGGRATTPKKA